MADEVHCSVQDRIATVTLNRPAKRNALNRTVVEGLSAIFGRLEQDPDVRVVVIRGAGPVFCAGMDLRELGTRLGEATDPERRVTEVFQEIERSRHPTIAMVQGDAFAGGCELALHCDLRVVVAAARFAMPLARLGLVVPFPLGQKLVEVVGPAFAREILLMAQPVGAQRAWEMGMIHRIVRAEKLHAVVYAMARSIADHAPLSLQALKVTILRAVAAGSRIEHGDVDELARRARKSQDAVEGVRAMLEKRRPVFRGE
jgi:enoyl-CoA hydratase/carnithine racemase